MKRRRLLAGLAMVAAAAIAAPGCRSTLRAEPIVIPAAARASYDQALEARARARLLSGEAAGAELANALASARDALARAPDEFRLAVLVQDLEFDLDPRAARERYVEAAPDTAAGRTLAARALLPERTGEAHDLLLAACEQAPRFAWARYGLGFVERARGNPDVALRAAEAALRLDPSLVEALRLVAELCEEGGDRERAVLARERLIEVTGGDLEERHRYARLLLDADDRSDATDAEKELRVILAALGDPPPPGQRRFAGDALVDLGTAYARRNRFEEAIGHWRHALAVDSDCLTALSNIGVVELASRDDPRAALAAFEEYLARAQSIRAPLGADQLLYRLFYVPNQVLELRQRLGLPTDRAAEPAPLSGDELEEP